MRLLQPVDLALHSALHLCLDGETGHAWRDLLDLLDLLGLVPGEDAAARARCCLDRAEVLGLVPVVAQALAPLCALLPQDALLQALARGLDARLPGWQRQAPARWMRTALGLDAAASPARRERAARCLYWRAHLLRMPLHLLLPHLVRKSWMGLRERFKSPEPA